MQENPSIDLVIPMVFPSDPAWQTEYNKAMGGGNAAQNVRFRSYGTEELLIRLCMKNMPWLRSIKLLLASPTQVQPWMELMVNGSGLKIKDDNHKSLIVNHEPQVRLVFHEQFIPAEYLPTFNVNTIEMFLHRIPDLSEYFIYSNDDFFPLSPLEESDFFQPAPSGIIQNSKFKIQNKGQDNNVQWLPCQHMTEHRYPTRPNIFQKFVKNGLDMVAADFGAEFRNTWLRTGHSMQPMLRSTVEHVCTRHADRILQSFTLRREPKNFNQYIFPFWQHLSGQYVDHVPNRRYIGTSVPTSEIASILREPNIGIVCLNDNGSIDDWQQRAEIIREVLGKQLSVSGSRLMVKGSGFTSGSRLMVKGSGFTSGSRLMVKGSGSTSSLFPLPSSLFPLSFSLIDVLIIHYNTPELTAAAIQSLWKHTPNARVTVFDNSDKRSFGQIQNETNGHSSLFPQPSDLSPLPSSLFPLPSSIFPLTSSLFPLTSSLFTLIDNTHGQVVDWNEWLAQFPDKIPAPENNWGSAKHCYSVEVMMDRFPNGFILMDSDVLVKQDISDLVDTSVPWKGGVHCNTRRLGVSIPRVIPFLCWINTPLLAQRNIRYFNPQKMWKLHSNPSQCWYDTGAWLLEACNVAGLLGTKVDIKQYIEHYGHASWRRRKEPEQWLQEHKELWYDHNQNSKLINSKFKIEANNQKPTANSRSSVIEDSSLFPLPSSLKYTVLTYIFGDYEKVHEVREPDPNAEYILVTDRTDITSRTWKIVHYAPEGKNILERMYDVRFHPFQFCDTELVVRLDASIGINRPLLPIIEQMQQGGYDRCLMIHPRRNTMTAEYAAWVRRRGYSQAQADRCLDYMRQQGYPMDYKGLFQSCFEVVRNVDVNTEINDKVMDILRQLAPDGHIERINQTILSFVINHYHSDKIRVLPVTEHIITDGHLMLWYRHNSNRPNLSRQKIAPVMFNRLAAPFCP